MINLNNKYNMNIKNYQILLNNNKQNQKIIKIIMKNIKIYMNKNVINMINFKNRLSYLKKKNSFRQLKIYKISYQKVIKN